ncbi:MAG: ABC-2 family transporter protein [Candidatus Roizmanbacteria bacterium]|nr:ABC-2 family transporter protein [Candidatus Roizmanbacteria bacterium]
MRRYLRIYKAVLKINLSLILAYRANFISHLFSTTAWAAFNFIWIGLLTHKASSAFGWRSDELVVITIGYIIITGIYYFLFAHNFENFSQIIDHGRFDSILLKPLDSQFQISMMDASYASLIRTVLGVIGLIWWVSAHHYSVGLFQVVSFIVLMGVGVVVMYSVWFLFITTLIWYPNLSNIVDFLYTLNGFARYPAEMLRNSGIPSLILLVPISLIVATPVKILLQKNAWGDILLIIVIGCTLFWLSRIFWKFALKHYTSAS